MKDQSNNIISATNINIGTTGNTLGSLITFTNGYIIPAGTSIRFKIYVSVVVVGNDQYLSTTLGTPSNFEWTDMTGNVSVNGSVNSQYYWDWPTMDSYIHN